MNRSFDKNVHLFLLFRTTNFYGDLHPWVEQDTKMFTLLSILNVTKYPPSFSFISITIGSGFLFLAAAQKLKKPSY
jgi:uncharacterized membrane protein